MKPVKYMLLLLALTALSYTFQSCKRNPGDNWTAKKQTEFYNKFYTIGNSVLTNEPDKKAFAECGVGKIKTLLPDGPDKMTTDSLNAVTYRISKACITDIHPTVNIWNPAIEKALKGKLMEYPVIRNLKPEIREAFCDCYLDTIKKLYPNGISGALPVNQQNEIAASCLHKVNPHK